MRLMNAKEDTRKNLVMKARVEEVRHNLRNQLDKEKKHQWYIYRRRTTPTRGTRNSRRVSRRRSTRTSPCPSRRAFQTFLSCLSLVSSVGIAAGVLLVSNHIKIKLKITTFMFVKMNKMH